MATSRVGLVTSYLLVDVVGSIFFFPVWWYTHGALGVARWLRRGLAYRWRGYAVTLWLRSFFVPMYGSYDWAGRLISVIMRTVVILARTGAFLIEAGVSFCFLLVWLAAPLICGALFVSTLGVGLPSWFESL